MTMNISFKRDCISFCISQTMCVQPEGKTHYNATLIAWVCVLKLSCCEKSNQNKPGRSPGHLLAGQGAGCLWHTAQQGQRTPMKSENRAPQITVWLSVRRLCWFSVLGGGTSREAVHVLPKSPEKEINPTSPCALSLGRGSVAGWDPLWRLPRLPLLLNKCLSVCPASVRAAGCVWGQHSCLGPA